MTIIAAVVSLGLGIAVRPEALSQLPKHVQTFFGNAIVMAALVSLIFDNIISKEGEVKPAETDTGVQKHPNQPNRTETVNCTVSNVTDFNLPELCMCRSLA